LQTEGCTEESHRAYLRRIKEELAFLADLIDSAPCGYTLTGAVLMVRTFANGCDRHLEIARAIEELTQDRKEKLRQLFGLN
jgi:hypothetical protein